MFGKPVTVRALGMLARVLQHEADHLDGTLFVDHLPEEDRRRFLASIP
jgi:peptide deformylase